MKSDNVQFVNNSSRLKNCESSCELIVLLSQVFSINPLKQFNVFIIHLCLCVLFKPEISSPQSLLLHESNDTIV